MNHRETTQTPKGMRQAVPCLASLLAVVAPGTALAAGRQMSVVDVAASTTAGYLVAVGAPPLRFAAPPPPPDLMAHPLPLPPTPPAPTAAEAAATRAKEAAAHSKMSEDITLDGQATPSDETKTSEPGSASTPSPLPIEKPTSGPSTILPDEYRPQVRAEDFLPYFQIPASGAHGDVTIIAPLQAPVPSSSPLPQSSATYIQTQK